MHTKSLQNPVQNLQPAVKSGHRPAAGGWPLGVRLGAVALAVGVVTGCASVKPSVLSPQEAQNFLAQDAQAQRKGVEPISAPLTLEEAMARALKYNLDRRTRMMEEALAMGQLDVSKFDMLPKIMAQAGYDGGRGRS